MAKEANGRPGGVDHPEKGSEVQAAETKDGDAAVDAGGGAGGAEPLRGADAHGEAGSRDLGRGGD